MHFSYEFEAELLFSVAQKRYPDQKNIASFLFEDDTAGIFRNGDRCIAFIAAI